VLHGGCLYECHISSTSGGPFGWQNGGRRQRQNNENIRLGDRRIKHVDNHIIKNFVTWIHIASLNYLLKKVNGLDMWRLEKTQYNSVSNTMQSWTLLRVPNINIIVIVWITNICINSAKFTFKCHEKKNTIPKAENCIKLYIAFYTVAWWRSKSGPKHVARSQ
jgi:hypothetical protein